MDLTRADHVVGSTGSDMINRLERWYRVLATGIGFLVFGVLVLFLSVMIWCSPRVEEARRHSRRKQRLASLAFRAFLGFLYEIGVFRKLEFRGLDRIPRDESCVFVSNHPTLLDPVVLLSVLGPADCILKEKHMSFFAVISRWFNYIPDQSSTELFDECVDRLEDGHSLMLFPERTRSPEGGLRPFSRVPAQVCLAADCPVVPVLIEVNHHAFGKDQAWYEVPPEPLHMRVTFFDPHKPDVRGRFSAASRTCVDAWERFYERHLPVESL